MSFSNYNTVSLLVNLPVTANSNDCYFVAETSKWYYYNGTNWIVLNDNLISLEHRILALEGATISASGITDGNKGDVTVSNSGQTWLIPDLVDLDNRVTTLENNPSSGGSSQNDYTELWLKFNGVNNSTDFVDDSKNSYLVKGNAIISTTQSKFNGSSLFVDNNTSALVPIKDFFGDFTVEFWCYPTVINQSGYSRNILDSRPNGVNGDYLSIGIQPGTGKILVANGQEFLTTNVININNWHHIAISRKSKNSFIWVNGLLGLTFSDSVYYKASNLLIGTNAFIGFAPETKYNGYIDNLRISSKAIYTPTLYPNGFTLPDKNFNVTAL